MASDGSKLLPDAPKMLPKYAVWVLALGSFNGRLVSQFLESMILTHADPEHRHAIDRKLGLDKDLLGVLAYMTSIRCQDSYQITRLYSPSSSRL